MTEIPAELRNKCTSFLAHAISLSRALLKRVPGKLAKRILTSRRFLVLFMILKPFESSLSKATLVVTTCKLAYSRESIERIELLDQLQTVLIGS